jgi:hypothetical protein
VYIYRQLVEVYRDGALKVQVRKQGSESENLQKDVRDGGDDNDDDNDDDSTQSA